MLFYLYIEEEIDEETFNTMSFEFLGNFIKKLGPRQVFWNVLEARRELFRKAGGEDVSKSILYDNLLAVHLF